ncbi:hypothetical protein ACHAXT_010458 [Thalassiosira profunda]
MMRAVLHRCDRCRPTDSKLALACLWWKAIAGNDVRSPVYDYQLSYDLLPPATRWFVGRRVRRWYPRLHHANVEIRTAYLDKSLANVINTIMRDGETTKDTTKIRLIVMGGGYDTRSFKLMERSLANDESTPHIDLLRRKRQIQQPRRWRRMLRRNRAPPQNAFDNITSLDFELECHELDLPVVVKAKRQLLRDRLFRRRPWLRELTDYPRLVEADFNDLDATRRALEGILRANDDDGSAVHNVILFEGVMIYLDEGTPHALLQLCSEVLNEHGQALDRSSSSYLCFADRLENIPDGDEDAANAEMESTGWELVDWLSKPGLARHMGVARLKGVGDLAQRVDATRAGRSRGQLQEGAGAGRRRPRGTGEPATPRERKEGLGDWEGMGDGVGRENKYK